MIQAQNKKISFKDVAPGYIYTKPKGWEIRLENGTIPAGTLSRRGIPAEDKKSARLYLKGLRTIFARAKEGHTFDDVMGNYGGCINKKYMAILKGMNRDIIEAIGMGEEYSLTFYVDGSVDCSIGNYRLSLHHERNIRKDR